MVVAVVLPVVGDELLAVVVLLPAVEPAVVDVDGVDGVVVPPVAVVPLVAVLPLVLVVTARSSSSRSSRSALRSSWRCHASSCANSDTS